MFQECHGKCAMAEAYPPAPLGAVLQLWGLPHLQEGEHQP